VAGAGVVGVRAVVISARNCARPTPEPGASRLPSPHPKPDKSIPANLAPA